MILKNIFSQVLTCVACVFLCIGCYSVHHGYQFDDQKEVEETLQMMVDRSAKIDDIVAKFGSPTFINSPINDTLCYASADGSKIMFNRFYNPKYAIMCVSFINGIAKKLEVKKVEHIKKEKFVKYDIKFDKRDYINPDTQTNKN